MGNRRRAYKGKFYEARKKWEREYFTKAIADTSKTLTQIAKEQGLTRSHMYELLHLLGIEPRRSGRGHRGNSAWLALKDR